MKYLLLSIVILSGFFATQANANECSDIAGVGCSATCLCTPETFADATGGGVLTIDSLKEGETKTVTLIKTGTTVRVIRVGNKFKLLR